MVLNMQSLPALFLDHLKIDIWIVLLDKVDYFLVRELQLLR